jgi:hypothetical protein
VADYDELADTAEELIREYGREMTLRTETSSGDAWNPVISTSDATVVGVVTSFSKFEVANGLVDAQDKRILFAGNVPVTNAKSVFDTGAESLVGYGKKYGKNYGVIGGVEYSIVAIDEVKPGPVTMIYKAQVRK